MAWTAPRTWVALETVTAAIMNAHLRDNMLETEAATAQAAGDLIYADAANSMGGRVSMFDGPEGAGLVSTGSAPVWRRADYAIGNGAAANNRYQLGGTVTTWSAFVGDLGSGFLLEGDAVTAIVEGTSVLVSFGCRFAYHETAGVNVQLSVAVDDPSSSAFSTAWGTAVESDPTSNLAPHFRQHLFTGLSSGSNHIFYLGAQCGAGGGAASFAYISMPWILAQGL